MTQATQGTAIISREALDVRLLSLCMIIAASGLQVIPRSLMWSLFKLPFCIHALHLSSNISHKTMS